MFVIVDLHSGRYISPRNPASEHMQKEILQEQGLQMHAMATFLRRRQRML